MNETCEKKIVTFMVQKNLAHACNTLAYRKGNETKFETKLHRLLQNKFNRQLEAVSSQRTENKKKLAKNFIFELQRKKYMTIKLFQFQKEYMIDTF